jgi:hypothetical protein
MNLFSRLSFLSAFIVFVKLIISQQAQVTIFILVFFVIMALSSIYVASRRFQR